MIKQTKQFIGFSTGCLYRSNLPMSKVAELYYANGANAIELGFKTPADFFKLKLTDKLIKAVKKFSYISIHAPWKEVRYDQGQETKKIVKKLKEACAKLPIKGIVLHPGTIDDFTLLNKPKLPFLLENMDGRKRAGTHPEDFKELGKKCKFNFVLDLQHAYEHDPSMKLAKDFVKMMGSRLQHLHVSGNSETEIHVPTFCAQNQKAIVKALKLKLPGVKILEGILLEDIENSIKKELDFVAKFK